MSLPGIWGGVLVCGIFCSVWANDSFAYLVGSKFGKHARAAHLTEEELEGFIGGLVGSMAIWCLITLIPGVNMAIPPGARLWLDLRSFWRAGRLG